jgi:hypothetical protein
LPDEEYRLVRAKGAVLWTGFERYEQCEAACAYHLKGPEQKMHAAWWGIFVHRFLEYVQTKGREAALKYVGEKRLKGLYDCCSKIDVNALPEGQVELGHAFDPLTGEVQVTGRQMRVPEQFQHGILDLLALKDRCPWVVDYKTGDISGTNPGEVPQLLGNMLAVRANWSDPWNLSPAGATRPEAYYVSLAQVDRDGTVTFRTAQLSDQHLDNFHHRARRIQLKVLNLRRKVDHGESVAFQPGEACGSCSIAPACPALQQAGAGNAGRVRARR